MYKFYESGKKSENKINWSVTCHSSCFWMSMMCSLVTWLTISSCKELIWRVFSWVDFITTNGAELANIASLHLAAHKHQRSPGFKPGKPPLLVDRSLPLFLVKVRKVLVMVAQTTWTPWSPVSVRQ